MAFKPLVPDILKYTVKHVVWDNIHKHQSGARSNLCIFTTRRSGGTWLTETLSMEKGILYVMQPFSKGIDDPYLRRRGVFAPGVIENGRIPIRGRDDEWMFAFFSQVFAGELKVENPWNIIHKGYDFVTDRVCAKMHDTKAWIEWFEESFDDIAIIYHLRHPIPQSLSTIQRGWIITIPYYLKDEWFVENFMSDDLMRYTDEILRSGTKLEKYVANWCIENLVPLKTLRNHQSWLVLSYEELVVNPQKAVDLLAKDLELTSYHQMIERVGLPSGTVINKRTKDVISGEAKGQTKKQAYLLRRWERSVSGQDKESAFRVLDTFGIDAFNPHSIVPSNEILNFEDSAHKLQSIPLP